MRTDFWRAAKLLLAQLLKLDINEQLVREVDYLMAENQVLRNQIATRGRRLKFTDEQRRLLVDKAKLLGRRLFEVVTIVRPETILRWQQKLIAYKLPQLREKSCPKIDGRNDGIL